MKPGTWTVLLWLELAGMTVLTAWAQDQGPRSLPIKLKDASAAQAQTEVPFHLIDGWAIVLEGTLGGVPHQNMLIDTGAVPSAINIKLARQLGLSGPLSGLSLMNRSISIERVHVPKVRLGPVAVESLDMVTMDLGRIEQALGTRINAVIGLDLLAKENFSLDYRGKSVNFGKSAPVVGTIAFQTRQEGGGTYILVPLESGGERIEVLLDTGTKDLMLFERRLKGGLRHLRSRVQDLNLNAGGQDHLTEVELRSVKVGQLSLTDLLGSRPNSRKKFNPFSRMFQHLSFGHEELANTPIRTDGSATMLDDRKFLDRSQVRTEKLAA